MPPKPPTALLVLVVVELEVVSVVPVIPIVEELAATVFTLIARGDANREVVVDSSKVSTITCDLTVFVINKETRITKPEKRK